MDIREYAVCGVKVKAFAEYIVNWVNCTFWLPLEHVEGARSATNIEKWDFPAMTLLMREICLGWESKTAVRGTGEWPMALLCLCPLIRPYVSCNNACKYNLNLAPCTSCKRMENGCIYPPINLGIRWRREVTSPPVTLLHTWGKSPKYPLNWWLCGL